MTGDQSAGAASSALARQRVARYVATVAALVGVAAVVGAGAAAAKSKLKTDHTFAGYEVTEAKTHIHAASVTFTVPTITCHKSYSGVGPSVLITSTTVKHHYSYSGGGIAVVCQSGQPDYVALPIVDGTNYNDDNVTIDAGDEVTVSVQYGKTTAVTLTDDTLKEVDKRTGKGSTGYAAYFGDSGVQINHQNVGLDPFTATSFSAATVNGRAIGRDKPARYEWVDGRTVLVTAGPLSDLQHFTTTFEHSN